jgi:hypothetical protein
MPSKKDSSKKRGPKGGVKHQPGKGHDRKSLVAKKKRFVRKVAKKMAEAEANARQAWAEWDKLPDEVKLLLGPTAQPKLPRPDDG